jgi:hypothetical protein
MRRFIDIVEARRKIIAVDPAAQAQQLYAKAVALSRVISRALAIRQWDMSGIAALRKTIEASRKAHEAGEAEAADWADEDNPYTARPFVLKEALPEITALWWDETVKPHLYEMQTAAKQEYERYQDEHPAVEQSDQMSLLHDEVTLTNKLYYHAADTLQGLDEVLTALDNFAHSLSYLHDIDYSRPATRETTDFVAMILPAIVSLAKLYGAQPNNPG